MLLASSIVLAGMQFSTSAVALPALIEDLQPPLRWAGWVFTTYTLGSIVALPLAGRLVVRYGARRIYLAGVLGFAALSLACALAPNIWVLILARAGQGIFAALMQPAIFGIVGEQFAEQRAKWIGLLGSLIPLSAVIGPNVGGLLVDTLGWRWTFGFNAPLAVLLALLAYPLLPVSARGQPVRFNVPSIALLGIFATTLLYAMTELGRSGVGPNPLIVASFLVAAGVALLVLVRRELRSTHPIVDLDLLRRREFMFANGLSFVFGFCFIGMFSFVPLYAQDAYGLSASETGLMLTPRALLMSAVGMTAALLLARTGYRRPILVSMWAQGALLTVLALGIHEPTIAGFTLSDFAWLTLVNGVFGFVFGIGHPSMQNAALDLAPDRIPAVIGLRGMFSSMGGTIGVATITVVTARSGSIEQGLELSFVAVAALYAAGSLFALGIPEMGRARPLRTAEPVLVE